MKKLAATLVFSALFGLMPVAVVAAKGNPTPGNTTISGSVTYASNGNPVKNAKNIVTVTCNGNVLMSDTNGAGKYSVVYTNTSSCPIGAVAYVTVSDGAYSGKGQVTVTQQENSVNDIGMTDVTVALPEMGLLAAAGAAVVAGGAFVAIRRRNLSTVKE